MQSSSSEGIYASLQILPTCFYPVQSPHELEEDASPHSPPTVSQALELTHFSENQLQQLWDIPNDVEGLDTLEELGLFDQGSVSFQESLNTFLGLDENVTDISNYECQIGDKSVVNGLPNAEMVTQPKDVHQQQIEPQFVTSPTETASEKQPSKRPYDSIDYATNLSPSDATGPPKRQCHSLVEDSEIQLGGSYTPDKYPSPSSTPASIVSNACPDDTNGQKGNTDVSQSVNERTSSPQEYRDSRAQRESSVDSLFDDDIDGSTSNVAPTHHPLSLPSTKTHTQTPSILSLPEYPTPVETAVVGEPQLPPTASDIIKTTNSIGTRDLFDLTHREIFTMPSNTRKYISPYPRIGGPLGYLPSTPNAHLKCIEVAEETVVDRVDQYRKQLQNLKYDRNKYMWLSKEWTDVNSRTGKTKAQEVKEECATVKRQLGHKEKQLSESKTQVEYWRKQCQTLALAYNKLAHQYQNITAPQTPSSMSSASQSLPGSVQSSQPSTRAPSICGTGTATVSGGRISIDLTVDEPERSQPRPQSHLPKPNVTALTQMRRKSYQWLSKSQDRTSTHPSTQVSGGEEGESNENNEENSEDGLSQMLLQELESTA